MSQDEDQLVAEEYETWKKNCPYMYDMVSETALLWPSLTFQWLPDYSTDNGVVTQKMLLGTYSAHQEKEYLQVASVQFPSDDADDEVEMDTQIKIEKKILHEKEVNRARYQPGNSRLVATASVSGDVYLFDISTEEEEKQETEFKPLATLKGHSENGYGISWSQTAATRLVSSSDDGTVALWDVGASPGSVIEPVRVYDAHTDTPVVNDVDYHKKNAYIFGSAVENKHVYLYDTRTDSKSAIGSALGHDSGVNSLSFSGFSEYLFVSVSDDQTVAIWDTRNLSKKLHSLMGHTNTVTSVQWSPHEDGVLASAGRDRRVMIWDIRRIGEEQTQEDAEDGAPELLFMHGGHTETVNDFDFNPHHKWYFGSVADDNIAQIWRPSESIVGAPNTEVPKLE